MATTINKQRQLTRLFSLCKPASEGELDTRPVLQQFIYGLCREGACSEDADRAYRFLCEKFFDWNEIRVSSVRELEDAFEGMPDAELRSERLIMFLQELFETKYSFDLEDLQKKGLKVAAKQLGRYKASNDYIVSWVTQRSLGGHAVPLDAPTLRCSRRLALIDANQGDHEAARASLEHLVPKAKGALFTDLISQIADEVCWDGEPDCPNCPLVNECPYAQEAGVAQLAGARSNHRSKSR